MPWAETKLEEWMSAVVIGEVWEVQLGDERRVVEVEGSGTLPGWWLCIDKGTGAQFSARETWFIRRIAEAEKW